MNLFRLCSDMLHLVSTMLLIFKLHRSKSCVGVSCCMQGMYALVFGGCQMGGFSRGGFGIWLKIGRFLGLNGPGGL